jgi:hypothetical protein
MVDIGHCSNGLADAGVANFFSGVAIGPFSEQQKSGAS